MDKVNATMERYGGSLRITPERPFKGKKKTGNEWHRVKAEIFHWEESDAMDVFILPPRNPALAVTQVVKRFAWGGSISRSIYGQYTMRLSPKPNDTLDSGLYADYLQEMLLWIANDRKTFNAMPRSESRKKNSKSTKQK